MSIRFLNCASMSPWWLRVQVGALCLLVDSDQGAVLVDTGLGLHDHEEPSRMGRFFRAVFGIHNAPEETAVRQVARLGIEPESVCHIVLTHVHFDHAGGLPDFPRAEVHLIRAEYDAMRHPRKWIERTAYLQADFVHGPKWVLYDGPTEKWYDFDAVPLPFNPRMFLVPLFGHTSGHCGVAIETETGWLFQAGDSIPFTPDLDSTPDWLNRLVIGDHVHRLKAFAEAHPEVRMVAGHALIEFFQENSGID